LWDVHKAQIRKEKETSRVQEMSSRALGPGTPIYQHRLHKVTWVLKLLRAAHNSPGKWGQQQKDCRHTGTTDIGGHVEGVIWMAAEVVSIKGRMSRGRMQK